MNQATQRSRIGRLAVGGVAAVILAMAFAACGSSAPASPSPSQAASTTPASAPPVSTAPSVAPPASVAPSTAASVAPATDPTIGLKIDAPYTLTALPAALQTTLETQMASGLGAFGGSISFGFRQVGGGAGPSILMVIGFPTGSLNATAYQAALAGMGSSMGTTFATTTVDGVDVANGTSATGGVAVFHIGDHMLVVISPTASESLPISTALIKANQ